MEDIFSKVRTQVKSTLDNQKRVATTLLAVEKTLKEKDIDPSPTAYLTTLLDLLQELPSVESAEENESKAALVYLLSFVLPHLPQDVLKAEYSQLLTTFVDTLEGNKTSAPITRATIACLEALLIAQDSTTWNKAPAKKTFQSLMSLCLDGRPKVRRRAHEAVHKILAHPPSSSFQHPASFSAAKFCIKVLKESTEAEHSSALHILALAKPMLSAWPLPEFSTLLEVLLQLPKFNNDYLTVAVFEVVQTLFEHSNGDFDQEKTDELLKSLMDMKPSNTNVDLSIAWLKSVNYGYNAYAKCNPEKCSNRIGMVFALVFPDLACDHQQIIDVAAECLSSIIKNCVTDDLIAGISDNKSKNSLRKISSLLETGLRVRYKSGWPGVLAIYSTLFEKLGRSSMPLLSHAIELIAELRTSGAECIKEIDVTLGSIVAVIGPKEFLNLLPLNLEKPSSDTEHIERAWLLPILKDSIINTELEYFVKELVPLTERLQEAVPKSTNKGKATKPSTQGALVQEIWALLPGFCNLPYDFITAFDQEFAELLGNKIYSEPELRPSVCASLQMLIQKNIELSNSETSDEELQKQYLMDKKDALANIQHLSGFSTNFLAIFFNIFSQTLPQSRDYLLEIIQLFFKVTTESDVSETFTKVHHLLAEALKSHTPASSEAPSKLPPTAHTMMDLAVAMIGFLNSEDLGNLLETIIALVGQENDDVLQEVSYKAINRMCECANGKEVLVSNIETIQTKLLDTTLTTTSLAKEERLRALASVIRILPSSDLSMIPSVLSEAIVGTKQANETIRNLAYDLLVVMGNRMIEGGTVVTSKIAEMDSDAPDAEASIAEYFTMVTAGLAGSTPNMISATITSLSRLLFEFQSNLSQAIVDDLLKTIHMFVVSANRELVKSALGFVKVAVLTLDSEFLKPHLSDIITGILTWSRDHKNHFKDKVRHIFERLIRKFGYEDVAQHIPEEHMGMIVNIKNRKERARRGKNKPEDSDDEEDDSPQKKSENTYNSVLDSSDSEMDDSDDEGNAKPRFNNKRRGDNDGDYSRDGQNKRYRGRGGSSRGGREGQRFGDENRGERRDSRPYDRNSRVSRGG
ncbi:pre-rRNA processing protein, partial [Basidiobolus ranarum]